MKYAIMIDGNHEYDINAIKTESSTSYEMRFSQGKQWTELVRGEHIFSATDNGNGIKFTEKFKKSFDYDKFYTLKIFMDFITQQEPIQSKIEFIKK
jgi:hypothetical protein